MNICSYIRYRYYMNICSYVNAQNVVRQWKLKLHR